MEYNTKRTPLILKEYGRNVQKLAKYICDIQDEEERTHYSNTLVRLMKRLNPSIKDLTNDNPQRIWDHLHLISNLKLNIDAPYPLPDKSILIQKPKKIQYHKYELHYKCYGRNIELLIKRASSLTDMSEKETLAINIGKLMKNFYNIWNKESVDGITIVNHIKELSEEKIDLTEVYKNDTTIFNSPERSKPNSSFSRRRYDKRRK